MQVQDSGNDLDAHLANAERVEDARLQQVHERLDCVSRSLEELRPRREASRQAGGATPSPGAARHSIEVANARLAEIQAELDGLRIAMRNRALIEQAKGMLMVRLQIDESTAFDYLRTMSNRSNRKLVDVAGDVVRTRAGEDGLR